MKVPSVRGREVESRYSARLVVERVDDGGTPEAFEGEWDGVASAEDGAGREVDVPQGRGVRVDLCFLRHSKVKEGAERRLDASGEGI
jgi:hypothetical protein